MSLQMFVRHGTFRHGDPITWLNDGGHFSRSHGKRLVVHQSLQAYLLNDSNLWMISPTSFFQEKLVLFLLVPITFYESS